MSLFLIVMALWFMTGFSIPAALDKDWVAFDQAGWRALNGDWRSVYAASAGTRWPYLYPPFTIYLAVPLGLLPFYPSYLVAAGSALIGTVWSLRRLAEQAMVDVDRRHLYVSMVLLCPTGLQTFITGQYSWIYLVAVTAAIVAWRRDDGSAAGWSLALLCIKPNLAVFFAAYVIARRDRRAMRSGMVAAVAMVAISLPFGLGPWLAFARTAGGVASRQEAGDAPIEKQVTLQAFLRLLAGGTGPSGLLVWTVWSVAVIGLGIAVWRVWRRGDLPPLRLVGTVALFTVTANPRLYFYDALLLAVPAAGWYLQPTTYRSPVLWRLIAGIAAAMVMASLSFFWVPAAGTALGPLAMLWLIAEVFDSGRRAAATLPGAVAEPDQLGVAA